MSTLANSVYGPNENSVTIFETNIPGDTLNVHFADDFAFEAGSFAHYDRLIIEYWNDTTSLWEVPAIPWMRSSNQQSTNGNLVPPTAALAATATGTTLGTTLFQGGREVLTTGAKKVKFTFTSDSSSQTYGWKVGVASNYNQQAVGQPVTAFMPDIITISSLSVQKITYSLTTFADTGAEQSNFYNTDSVSPVLLSNNGTVVSAPVVQPTPTGPLFIKIHCSELALNNHINTKGDVDDVIFCVPYDIGGSSATAYKRHEDVMFSHVEYNSVRNMSSITIRLTDQLDKPVFLPKESVVHLFMRVFYVQG
jgi:hypothetical protein